MTDVETIAEGLTDKEREWVTGWRGARGAAFVAWLRGEVETDYTDPEYDKRRNLADAVERGAYIQDQSK